MNATTVTTEDWRALYRHDPAAAAGLLEWLVGIVAASTPLDPQAIYIMDATLGEGVVEVVLALPDMPSVDGELETSTVTCPAPTLPPCWPVGLANRGAA